ncbi:ATP-binding protein [Streptomyces zingiberis]|uniref:ATP-binding protein n=1 Tax=Streptomyces zingiberis TaxID=2053010 RepID=A0ABX1BT36_9ACTN|nr:ATP-binding protein [Streptomyces zingiberis]NJQ00869.1 ATP-binding protein [Streptomyces zingiberis]
MLATPTPDCSLVFPPDPVWVRAAREAVRALLAAAGRPDLTGPALLLTSEVVTNAVNACRSKGCTTPVTVFAEWLGTSPGRLRVLVHDEAPGLPVRRTPRPDEESGRGLLLISAGADDWGVYRHGPGEGKATWFELGVRETEAVPVRPGQPA